MQAAVRVMHLAATDQQNLGIGIVQQLLAGLMAAKLPDQATEEVFKQAVAQHMGPNLKAARSSKGAPKLVATSGSSKVRTEHIAAFCSICSLTAGAAHCAWPCRMQHGRPLHAVSMAQQHTAPMQTAEAWLRGVHAGRPWVVPCSCPPCQAGLPPQLPAQS